MDSAPAVSVLMPAYNTERYVTEAVRSILDQSFTDFEFLIVDDGSTDRTPEILDLYARRDSRIQLTRRPHTGYVPALIDMASRARGQFLRAWTRMISRCPSAFPASLRI